MIMLRQPFAWMALIAALMLAGCSNNRTALNEENSFFIRGMQLREEAKYDDAIQAFEQCLRHSPGSYRAHLQLAMIYEDHKQDLPRAIVHYSSYLAAETDNGQVQIAKQWRERAERKYFDVLSRWYGSRQVAVATSGDNGPTISGLPTSGLATASNGASPAAASATNAPVPAERQAPPAPATPATTPVVPPPATETTGTRFYTIKEGDTLRRIAADVLGNANDWTRILEANKDVIISPEKLKVGQRIIIPPQR